MLRGKEEREVPHRGWGGSQKENQYVASQQPSGKVFREVGSDQLHQVLLTD